MQEPLHSYVLTTDGNSFKVHNEEISFTAIGSTLVLFQKDTIANVTFNAMNDSMFSPTLYYQTYDIQR